MSRTLRINKVNILDKEGEQSVTIAYSRPPEDEPDAPEKRWDTDEITRSQPPLKSFKEALSSLAQDVVTLCEEQPEVQERIEVRTVNFKYPKGTMGANITALKWLEESNGMVLLTTPYKSSESLNENGGGDEKNVFDEETVVRLDRVIEEAKRYVNGERGERVKEQRGLFDEKVLTVLPELMQQVCESCSPELLAKDKAQMVKIEGVPYCCVSFEGNATEGFEEARVYRLFKPADYDGEQYSFQELPSKDSFDGLKLKIGCEFWVLSGEPITVVSEEPETKIVDQAQGDEWEEDPWPHEKDGE
jgi:hypothetical protein